MKVYIGSLPKQVNDEELNGLASEYGTVVSADVIMDRSSGESKGFGFIEFGTPEEGRAMITALNGTELHGQELKLDEAKPRK